MKYLFIPLILLLYTGCTEVEVDAAAEENRGTLFYGASVWTDGALVQDANLLVVDGQVAELTAEDASLNPADSVDVSGQFIVPGLINAHGHVGVAEGLDSGFAAHSEENVRAQLDLYAQYGVTTVVSLGGEPEEAFRVRDQQREDASSVEGSRLYLAGPVVSADTPQQARDTVEEVADLRADWVKIRVDDFLGRGEKMPEEVYAEVIGAAHDHGIPLAAHMVELEDAKRLIRNDADLLAHSVRDAPVDDELISLMQDNGICLTPTLTREVATYMYADRPEFFDDPFFRAYADEDVLEQLQDPDRQQNYTGEAADYYRAQLPLAEENMMALHEAGIDIALGTDSGPPARFQGYFEHMEMEMMQEAGMMPEEVLSSATHIAASCMNLADVGSLRPSSWADFVVLNSDPTEDIRHLQDIELVYLAGNILD